MPKTLIDHLVVESCFMSPSYHGRRDWEDENAFKHLREAVSRKVLAKHLKRREDADGSREYRLELYVFTPEELRDLMEATDGRTDGV